MVTGLITAEIVENGSSTTFATEPMKTDKEIQMEILTAAKDRFPGHLQFTNPDKQYVQAVLYLREYGLIRCNTLPHSHGIEIGGITITAKGIDYLSSDGGLTAELGVITVRLHEDTIRALLNARIDGWALPAEEKSALKKHLKALPDHAVARLTTRLVDQALSATPQAWEWIRTLLSEVASGGPGL